MSANPILRCVGLPLTNPTCPPGQGDTRHQEQQRIHRRNTPGGHGRKFLAQGAAARPCVGESRVGRYHGVVAAKLRDRDVPQVKQGAEEAAEEHHFGKDEPCHTDAVRAVLPSGVDSMNAFPDDLPEPTVRDENNTCGTNQHAPQALRHLVQAKDESSRQEEDTERQQQRVLAGMGDVVASSGHGGGIFHGDLGSIQLEVEPVMSLAAALRKSCRRGSRCANRRPSRD